MHRISSINQKQAKVSDDGRVRIVLAHEDPGTPNWLDTAGHLEGILQYRYIWTRDNPEPSIRALPVDDVRAAMGLDYR